MGWDTNPSAFLRPKTFQAATSTASITGWTLWINHYSEALNLDAHRLHFVSYEAYCTSPQEVLQQIVAAATQDAKVPAYAAYLKVRDVEDAVDAKRLAQARSLYAEMVRRGQS